MERGERKEPHAPRRIDQSAEYSAVRRARRELDVAQFRSDYQYVQRRPHLSIPTPLPLLSLRRVLHRKSLGNRAGMVYKQITAISFDEILWKVSQITTGGTTLHRFA